MNSWVIVKSNPSNIILQAIRTYSGTRATRYWRTARTSATSARVTCSNWWSPRCSQKTAASINVWPPTPLVLLQAVSLYLSMVSLSGWLIRPTRKPRYQIQKHHIDRVSYQLIMYMYVNIDSEYLQIMLYLLYLVKVWMHDSGIAIYDFGNGRSLGLLSFGTSIIMF